MFQLNENGKQTYAPNYFSKIITKRKAKFLRRLPCDGNWRWISAAMTVTNEVSERRFWCDD